MRGGGGEPASHFRAVMLVAAWFGLACGLVEGVGLRESRLPFTAGHLARVGPPGRQIIVERSEHFIQLDQPKAVVEAIRGVLAEVASAPRPAAAGDGRPRP